MASREIQLFSGSMEQSVADGTAEVFYPVRSNGRRAIQIYGALINFDYLPVGVSAVPSGLGVVLTAQNSDGTQSTELFRHGVSIGAQGVTDCHVVWDAPPGLLVGKDTIRLALFSDTTGQQQFVTYIIYWKPVTVTDVQALQLRRM